ncbi:uncharacterized protein LOC135197846 [Macrobrachium nipponense]|uniref:uncharacterized protein LOC135197846 n=1 Tax=Macrobrachium nipponense TaxID=159736 RepID=UPI0030C856AA
MISRVIAAYFLGLGLAVAMVGMVQAQNDTGGTSIEVSADVDDSYKYDQFIDVMLGTGQTVVQVVQSILGMKDPDKECCMDGAVKRENGETWTNDKGANCKCNTGNIACTFSNVTAPATP